MPEIRHYNGLNRTPALVLAVRGWMALIDAGHCSDYVQVYAEQDALVIFVDGVAAGVLTYRHVLLGKELMVGIGYIADAYRGQKLYGQLWNSLVEKAKELGAVHISSATFIENDQMRAVAQKQGRVERTVTLDYDVTCRP